MIDVALAVTLVFFTVIGAAAASLLKMYVPASRSGRLAAWFLIGIAFASGALYGAALLRLPLTSTSAVTLLVAAVIALIATRGRTPKSEGVSHALLPTIVLAVPLLTLFFAAAVLPIRDYDGRVTWLPKARAIAHEGRVDGPFFRGEAGLNPHNQYPLLLPIAASVVMELSGTTEYEAARWLYVFIFIAALLVARDVLAIGSPRSAAWTIAAVAWLPLFVMLEGGAVSAYNDVAVMAFFGLGVLLLQASDDLGAARTAGCFFAAVTLTKNEGVVLALAALAAAGVSRRLVSRRRWIASSLPTLFAFALLSAWKARVPAAYDERYEVLIRALPDMLTRLPAAAAALMSHALVPSLWGWFWAAAVIATVVALFGASRRAAWFPLLAIGAALCAYVLTLTVTSWDIDALASVAAPRLLMHLVLPAAAILALAAESIVRRFDAVEWP